MTDERARTGEEVLERVQRARRGKLRLYLGFAEGVGKTYRLLQEAHALVDRGTDVVLALIETHGRARTARLLEGLEALPRRVVEFRGVKLEELDLEAVLARRPAVAVVDDLAHANAPGSRNRKRWQDVVELLDAGVDVVGALDVQHLEGLSDLVQRVTGVKVRETVPDRFFEQADPVVNLDLPVDDLLERLEAGQIYPPEKVAWARERLFQRAHLATLRELSLREVAERLERAAAARPGPRVVAASRPGARVMVCLSSNPPHAATLLRRGSRLAGRLNTDWFVVYVQTPGEAPHLIDAEAQSHLLANTEKARELGAEFVRLTAKDPVEGILDFARSHGVGSVLIGRSYQPWWKQVLGRAVPLRLVREASGFDVHIVSFPDESDGEGEGEARP